MRFKNKNVVVPRPRDLRTVQDDLRTIGILRVVLTWAPRKDLMQLENMEFSRQLTPLEKANLLISFPELEEI